MKKVVLSILWVSMISCLGSIAANAQDDAAVRKELEAQYKKLAEAHEREDLKAIVALKTADFHSIFPDERVGDSKLMEEYSRRFLEVNQPPYNIRNTIQKLTVSPNSLIAVAEVLVVSPASHVTRTDYRRDFTESVHSVRRAIVGFTFVARRAGT